MVTGEPAPRPVRVLHVEDDRLVALVFAAAFHGRHRFELRSVDTVADACELVDGWSPDAFVIDSQLPDGDGVSLLRRLRADHRYSHTPAYMCSGDGRPNAAADALAAGFAAYWAKPLHDPGIPAELLRLADAVSPAAC